MGRAHVPSLVERAYDKRLAGDTPKAISCYRLKRWFQFGDYAGMDGFSASSSRRGPILPQGYGFLTIYPGDAPLPLASTLNFSPGQVRANSAMVLLAGDGSGRINAFASLGGGGTTDLLLDVNG